MKFSERVNVEILRRFKEADIEFAFPTQTIQLNQNLSEKKSDIKPIEP